MAVLASSLLLLSVFTPQTMAVDSFFDVFYDATVLAQIGLGSGALVQPTLKLVGPVLVRSHEIGDLDGDGKRDIKTEILSMDLVGKHPLLGSISIRKKQQSQSQGMAEQIFDLPSVLVHRSVPANSFFDVFVEMDFLAPASNALPPPVDPVLVSLDALHLTGKAKGLLDLSGNYNMNSPVDLGFENQEVKEPAQADTVVFGGGGFWDSLNFITMNLSHPRPAPMQ